MKIKSIKLSIIWNLFISLIVAAFTTGIILLLFFGILEIISQDLYTKLLNLTASTMPAMMITSFVMMVIYLLNAVLIFNIRLNEITDAIKKISLNIHKLAQGDFRDKLDIKSNHELGILANDINLMSDKIDAYIKNEQSWNEERYNMITNMSHDLKTPIMSIMGYIDLIKNNKYKDDIERNTYCEVVVKKSEELSTAINQIFELSKLNSSVLQIHKVSVNLKAFVEQVIISYIPIFEQNEMDFRIGIPSEISIMIDPDLMKRVFENIISNAIKYASSGKYLEIGAEKKENQVTLHFVNHGPMIPKEELEHIFERYYREKRNLQNEGNGLGLAIAKTIVQLHEGEMKVISEEGMTDFFIIL